MRPGKTQDEKGELVQLEALGLYVYLCLYACLNEWSDGLTDGCHANRQRPGSRILTISVYTQRASTLGWIFSWIAIQRDS